ncbi:helix-turn-helix domain-containing protein [Candidatus Electronema sp. JM]|uniref:helix-turn-helix domain-containing protein n=1 Tax=Candidatus Electronema sp. JM TaxID=3401571 RepID=UPI003AA8EB43
MLLCRKRASCLEGNSKKFWQVCRQRISLLLDVQEYSPAQIVSLRKKFKLSQAALASIFNISLSTVRKWEQGQKKPAGASRKLLDLMDRKGIDALI